MSAKQGRENQVMHQEGERISKHQGCVEWDRGVGQNGCGSAVMRKRDGENLAGARHSIFNEIPRSSDFIQTGIKKHQGREQANWVIRCSS